MIRWARYRKQDGTYWIAQHFDSDALEFDALTNHYVRDGAIVWDWDAPRPDDKRWDLPQQLAPRSYLV